MQTAGYEIVSLIALGMGLAVWVTERRNPSSRALGIFLVLIGAIILSTVEIARQVALERPMPFWARGLGALDALAFLAGTEWGLRVGETVATARTRVFGRGLIRVAQVIVIAYAIPVAIWPGIRTIDFGRAQEVGMFTDPRFLWVAGCWTLAVMLVLISGALVLRERPDKAEAARILSMMAVLPIFALSIGLPSDIAAHTLAAGEIIFLVGLLRYHNVQGARGAFMAQFLAPQVADMVRARGLKNAMARRRVELTVVCCDIRRFTAFAQSHPEEKVFRLLRDFYRAVGQAVSEFEGTIKDLAGDGALILIGAPVAHADHARRGLALARRIQETVRPVVRRYSDRMGLGVGVASGSVAVGIVGERARYEYAAVGPAVNLASRLCDRADDGEIQFDEATWQGAGQPEAGTGRRRAIKGVKERVRTYRITLS